VGSKREDDLGRSPETNFLVGHEMAISGMSAFSILYENKYRGARKELEPSSERPGFSDDTTLRPFQAATASPATSPKA
jgi:hypothetical protein